MISSTFNILERFTLAWLNQSKRMVLYDWPESWPYSALCANSNYFRRMIDLKTPWEGIELEKWKKKWLNWLTLQWAAAYRKMESLSGLVCWLQLGMRSASSLINVVIFVRRRLSISEWFSFANLKNFIFFMKEARRYRVSYQAAQSD